jgi:hypothetical protein
LHCIGLEHGEYKKSKFAYYEAPFILPSDIIGFKELEDTIWENVIKREVYRKIGRWSDAECVGIR